MALTLLRQIKGCMAGWRGVEVAWLRCESDIEMRLQLVLGNRLSGMALLKAWSDVLRHTLELVVSSHPDVRGPVGVDELVELGLELLRRLLLRW